MPAHQTCPAGSCILDYLYEEHVVSDSRGVLGVESHQWSGEFAAWPGPGERTAAELRQDAWLESFVSGSWKMGNALSWDERQLAAWFMGLEALRLPVRHAG
jgi:hypothetical protein